MMDQKGKISFSVVLFILVIVYGAFVAYKFISVRVDNTQIKTEVIDRIGIMRGADFTLEDGQKIIREILTAHNILAPEEQISIEGEDNTVETSGGSGEGADAQTTPRVALSIRFNDNKSRIRFSIKYDVTLNLMFFKSKQDFTIDGEVINVN